MLIRDAGTGGNGSHDGNGRRHQDGEDADWSQIWPFWRKIVEARETYAWAPDTPEEKARALWMGAGKRVHVVEDEDGVIVATASVGPNYGAGGPAAHIANAGFMVDPEHAGRGIGRLLAEHVLEQAKADGYRGMVFNAVVETNPAVRLWTSLGFTILGTVPEAYEHARHGLVGLHIMYRAL
ncbi:GNAT family N-acetyltransferase [Streptomyces himalayensis]|uniref:GNAT family N-acetyltransferase n=1 Tax=Streptomyces himalayensis subsp. himalayensis TaxID=2756131 RepID=A0A7W0DMT5_9ACTN|nr:GNAT family N-acetyltransferase [Streptomyces himalayensis]MBA2947533.1 GNAT family N-acetyltransferase [Streptomyces himalayensis subsp. himalayensis]